MAIYCKYGVLFSVRHHTRRTNELLNNIVARFAVKAGRIEWDTFGRCHRIIIDPDKDLIVHFQKRGNKYANYLEMICKDLELLRQIKNAFASDFPRELKIEEGIL
jgi:hypothetical protein